MALTIAIEGLGIIANADAVTNDTGGTGTGDWGFTGDGGVAWGLTTDTFLYGVSCISMALSNKAGWLYFDRVAGNELDFDIAGSEEGQHIYIWVHCPTIGLMNTLANTGLVVRLGTSTSDYRTFTIAGNDDSNGWDGGWKCFVIDPTKAGSVTDTGSYDPGSIQLIGVYADATATAKGDNIFVSQIAVGFGLRITGDSTTAWDDVVTYTTDLPNRAWGMMQEREGIYYAYGKMWIGDAAAQAAAVSFTNPSGVVIQFGISEYYNISSAWVTSADLDYQGLVIEDHASYTTTYEDGVLVGSDAGRSGSVIIGNANHDVTLDFYGGNHADSVTRLYGSAFKSITGSILWGDDGDHRCFSVVFEECAQFDPVGAVVIRNCNFINTASIDAALLWNESINIQKCNFIANTNGAGIEHRYVVGSPYDYTDLIFSGNTYDVLNSSAFYTTTTTTTTTVP